jgi:transcriptional regulator with XRE-family HTH domain
MRNRAQHDPRYKNIPTFLRHLREEAGLTQRDIGEIMGKPQSWVYNCETGNRRVDVAEFCDWCRACNIPPANAIRRLDRDSDSL